MPTLTCLELVQASFRHLPPALTLLSSLTRLNLTHNTPLQLSQECLEVLKQLPRLDTLELSKGSVDSAVWSVATFRVLSNISTVLPNLKVELCFP